ncbi:MAG TPA: hypothetical protein GXZ64_09735 [Clostridiaceae bacterium]|nr:hypothetical protein [Clostridiaceae bacterium]
MYPANIELAVAVCAHLGVPRAVALAGMKNYEPDPFAAALFCFPSGSLFINALSANDPESTMAIWQRVRDARVQDDTKLVVIINGRRDRVERTMEMMSLAASLKPRAVWFLGASGRAALKRFGTPVSVFKNVNELPFESLGSDSIVLAIGNVAVFGQPLIERVQSLGAIHVR